MSNMFKLQWIGCRDIPLSYSESWSQKDLLEEFDYNENLLDYILTANIKNSFIHIFDNNEGFVILTRTN